MQEIVVYIIIALAVFFSIKKFLSKDKGCGCGCDKCRCDGCDKKKTKC